MTDRQKKIYIGAGLALVTVVIWSGNYVVAKGIAKQIPPVSLAFYRWTLASLCIMPFALKKTIALKSVIISNKAVLFWAAVTGITIFNTLIYLAGHYTSAINLALIGTTSAPVFITVLAAIFLKEHISIFRITGMVICICGILFLLSYGSLQKLAHLHFGEGDLLVVVSSFSFAIYNTLVKKKPAAMPPFVFLFVVFATGVLCLLPFYIYEAMHTVAAHWTGTMIAIILYLGIGNSVIAYYCWNESIVRLGASGTSLFANLIPVFSTIEAVIFLEEDFSRIHLISGVLVIGGLIIANITTKTSTA